MPQQRGIRRWHALKTPSDALQSDRRSVIEEDVDTAASTAVGGHQKPGFRPQCVRICAVRQVVQCDCAPAPIARPPLFAAC